MSIVRITSVSTFGCMIEKYNRGNVQNKNLCNNHLGECCRFHSKIHHINCSSHVESCNIELIKIQDQIRDISIFFSYIAISISVDEIK
ncbi:hypothetical protein POWCR01_000201800 [Plasmodium ovale]|uniref:Uncharacterized protein n=1 Tax=Plasmodium ovale TaxID=36330 RepID=A0A1C3KK22_PLAOA|nr:hypothetical protein POWCR01_000201800 [Plasmodium ovale]